MDLQHSVTWSTVHRQCQLGACSKTPRPLIKEQFLGENQSHK